MPISGFAPHEPTLTHEHVYDISKTVLNESFDGFEINGYKYSNNEVWDVLLYASANRLSIKGAWLGRPAVRFSQSPVHQGGLRVSQRCTFLQLDIYRPQRRGVFNRLA